MGDLQNVLNCLSKGEDESQSTPSSTPVINNDGNFAYGEHVACIWLNDNEDKTN